MIQNLGYPDWIMDDSKFLAFHADVLKKWQDVGLKKLHFFLIAGERTREGHIFRKHNWCGCLEDQTEVGTNESPHAKRHVNICGKNNIQQPFNCEIIL